MKTHHIYILSVLLLLTGCAEKDFQSVLYEKEDRDVPQEIKDRYNILLDNDKGWFFAYKPSERSDTVYMHLHFLDEERYTYAADRENFLDPVESQYGIQGTYDVELYFGESSIWGDLKEEYHGATKFHILLENGKILLRRSDGFDGHKFELKPMDIAEQEIFNQHVQAEIDRIEQERILAEKSAENILKIEQLANLDQAYFHNIALGSAFHGIYSLDAEAKRLEISWVENNSVQSAASTYTITPWSLSFDNALVLGGVTVDSLKLGDYTNDILHIEEAGTYSGGLMQQSHVPNFAYPLANEFVFRLNQSTYKPRWQYEIADGEDGVGSGLQAEHDAVLQMGMTFGSYNLYVNNVASGYNRYGFTATLNGSAHYMWYQDVVENPDKSLMITQSTSVPENNLGNTNFRNLTPERKAILKAFYNKLLDGGVYVWPEGRTSDDRQRIRIINKQNSKIYLTLKWVSPVPAEFID